MKVKCKVYWNKKNGQGRVHIPKRLFEVVPEEIELKIPENFFKKHLKGGKKGYAKKKK